MAAVMRQLGVEATTGHWEFTLGAERVSELFGGVGQAGSAGVPFLAGNVRDTDFEEPVFEGTRMFEKGGVQHRRDRPGLPLYADRQSALDDAAIGRSASARTTCAGRWPMRARCGAQVVVLLSHNGFDVDRKMARRVEGIDVILTAHTHDALPAPVKVGRTLLIASGSHGKFLSRLDLEVADGRVTDFAYKLIPILADAIAPDPDMARLIAEIRAPHEAMLAPSWRATTALLFRRGTFGGTLDDLICDALLTRARGRDRAVARLPLGRHAAAGPGHHLGGRLQRHRHHLSGRLPHPHAGRDDQDHPRGRGRQPVQPRPLLSAGRRHGARRRLELHDQCRRRRWAGASADMRLAATGAPIEAGKEYVVSGWGSVNETVEGPPVWDVVATYLKDRPAVAARSRQAVSIVRASP